MFSPVVRNMIAIFGSCMLLAIADVTHGDKYQDLAKLKLKVLGLIGLANKTATAYPEASCDFEDPDLCGWSHDTNHDFDWKRNQFATPSGHNGTGPSYDHTFGNNKGGFYLYIEASSPRKTNDSSRLFSPVYPPDYNDGCFTFWYHMSGTDTGGIQVYLKHESQVFDEITPRWAKFGDQGQQWQRGYITIPDFHENFQIIIEGSRGTGYIGGSAIDDVQLSKVKCESIDNSTETLTHTAVDSCRGQCQDPDDEVSCRCNENRDVHYIGNGTSAEGTDESLPEDKFGKTSNPVTVTVSVLTSLKTTETQDLRPPTVTVQSSYVSTSITSRLITRKTYKLRPRIQKTTPVSITVNSTASNISPLTITTNSISSEILNASSSISTISAVTPPNSDQGSQDDVHDRLNKSTGEIISSSTSTIQSTTLTPSQNVSTTQPTTVTTNRPTIIITAKPWFTPVTNTKLPLQQSNQTTLLVTESDQTTLLVTEALPEYHVSEPASTAGNGILPVIPIISISLAIIIGVSALLAYHAKKRKTSRQSRLSQDSEMRFLQNSAEMEYYDSSLSDRIQILRNTVI